MRPFSLRTRKEDSQFKNEMVCSEKRSEENEMGRDEKSRHIEIHLCGRHVVVSRKRRDQDD
jgi:hypothetical protein